MSTSNYISDSGFVNKDIPEFSRVFTDHEKLKNVGYNALYKAKRFGKWYILKGLNDEYKNEPFYKNLLNKEFELSFFLDHHNIVKVIDMDNDPIVGICIVMEYIDGCTLKEFLELEHSSDVYRKILAEILDAMAYYHSKQIIHRDIKPENILITRNGNNVKIIDFGLSDTDYHAALKQPAGTVKYAAPEQMDPNAVIDCRADIYALGVILKNHFPKKYKSIAEKCINADREKRYSSAGEIINVLKKKSKALYLATALMVVAILMSVAVLATRYSYTPTPPAVKQKIDTLHIYHTDTVYMQMPDSIVLTKKVMDYDDKEKQELQDARNYIANEYKKFIDSIDAGLIVFDNIADKCIVFEKNLRKERDTRAAKIDIDDPFLQMFISSWNSTIEEHTPLFVECFNKIMAEEAERQGLPYYGN